MAESNPADESTPAAPAGKSSKLVVTIAVALLAAAGAGGGVYWFTAKSGTDDVAAEEGGQGSKAKGKAKDAKPKGPAIYVEFDPPFVVNFEARGMTRFLQVTVQVMTRDQVTADLVKQHDPVIRNDLLLLLSNQSYETISTREGKDQLRGEALEVVAKAIDAEGGEGKKVEQLYFTSFVMQ